MKFFFFIYWVISFKGQAYIKSKGVIPVDGMEEENMQTITINKTIDIQDEQLATYQKIAENVPQILSSYEDIEYLIPTGTAIQNARTSYLGNNLTRDGHHLSYHEGRYIASLTLINKLST